MKPARRPMRERPGPAVRLRALLGASFVWLVVALEATVAVALPSIGARRPDVQLVDAWERKLDLRSFGDRPVLLFYEDKDSSRHNDALKAELGRAMRASPALRKVTVLAVADLSAYDFWPARGAARDAIREESRKAGTPIYCDWDRQVGRALAVDPRASNVILYGRGGRVVFAHAGPLDVALRAKLLALLEREAS